MTDKKRKPFIVTIFVLQPNGECGRRDKEMWSISKDAARHAALARGWQPIKIEEKGLKKAA